jgi:ubiquinone/menaquinone biosynthesis C-methylase UbiE
VSLTDPEDVRAQYATEDGLQTRTSVWRPGPSGIELQTLVLDTVRAALPAGGGMPDVLEVGCGTGVFAARLVRELPAIALLAVDTSYRMVELTRERGVPAQVQDIQQLLAPDAAYDVVLALWMLYHVPDLDRGLAEVRRVLRPGGRFVAVTNGDQHVADLRREAGGGPVLTAFSSENGEESLRRHFDDVSRTDVETRAVFPDRAAALAYLASSDEDVDWSLPAEGWPREYRGHVTVFVAR